MSETEEVETEKAHDGPEPRITNGRLTMMEAAQSSTIITRKPCGPRERCGRISAEELAHPPSDEGVSIVLRLPGRSL